jgi:RimJ/RimL family protein N-acetyltransferase
MQGELVRLRAWEPADIEARMRWWNDEEVTRLLGPWNYPVTRAEQERQIAAASGGDPAAKSFAIETLAGELIGETGIRKIDWMSRKALFFITIGEKTFWGKGCGTDALKLVMRLAFATMNLNRLWLTVLAHNQRAIRCYEKCGFKREGLLRQESFVDGVYHDVLLMGALRADYNQPPGENR